MQKIERDVQAKWEKERVYEFDAPAEPRKNNEEKFLVTFPYPYMNGRLHLGHTFSLSKAEVKIKRKRIYSYVLTNGIINSIHILRSL